MSPALFTTQIGGREVPITFSSTQVRGEDATRSSERGQRSIQEVVDSSLFQRWVKNLDPDFVIQSVEIKGIVEFPHRIGLIFLETTAIDEHGRSIPGGMTLRDNTVSVLIQLVCEGKRYAVLVRQARLPIGKHFIEIPAGIIDGGYLGGDALRELQEEVPRLRGLFSMSLVDDLSPHPICLSPGGCNEEMDFFFLSINVNHQTMREINGSCGGLKDEREFTTAVVVPWEDLHKIPDGKLRIALSYLQDLELKALREELKEVQAQLASAIERIEDLRGRNNALENLVAL